MVYKFRDDSCNTLSLIENNELWFSFPSDFNDPFDSRIVYSRDFPSKENIEKWMQGLPHGITHGRKLSYKTFQREDILNLIKKKQEETNQKFFAICCFSADYDNLLLWSHYTNKHEGLCLGFETTMYGFTDCLEFNDIDIYKKCVPNEKYLPLIDVNYTDEIIEEYNTFSSDENKKREILRTSILNKASAWKYESEKRIMLPYPVYQKNKFKFNKKALKKIIFGCKCKKEFKDKVISLIKNNYFRQGYNIDLFDAICVRNKYALEFNQNESV